MSATRFSDLELLQQVSQGSDSGLSDLVTRYEGSLHTMFHCTVGEIPDSGDILAEVFLKLIRDAAALSEPISVCSVIFRTAVAEITRYLEVNPLESTPPATSALAAAVYSLPLEYKLIVVLRDVLRMSMDECHVVLEISPEESAHRLKRARLMLRRVLLRDKGSLPVELGAGAIGKPSLARELLV